MQAVSSILIEHLFKTDIFQVLGSLKIKTGLHKDASFLVQNSSFNVIGSCFKGWFAIKTTFLFL